MAPKVDEQANPLASRLQVIHELRLVFGYDRCHSLQFDNDLPEADEVWLIGLDQWVSFISQLELPLGNIGKAHAIKLDLKTFLIHRRQKPATHLSINFKNGPPYGVRLFGVE
jgi:hypothetical protein